jgi:hypothetical protein
VTQPDKRTISHIVFDGRLAEDGAVEVTGEALDRVYQHLLDEGMQVFRTVRSPGIYTALCSWGPLDFELTHKGRQVQVFVHAQDGPVDMHITYDRLAVKVTAPYALTDEQLAKLSPSERRLWSWILDMWEDYLPRRLEALLYEVGGIREQSTGGTVTE